MRHCHRNPAGTFGSPDFVKGCIGNLGVKFEPETCEKLDIACVIDEPPTGPGEMPNAFIDERKEEMTPDQIFEAVREQTKGQKLSSTTFTVTPKPGEKHWADEHGLEQQPISSLDIREAGTHIAHHIQDAASVIAVAILLGCIVNGCIGLMK